MTNVESLSALKMRLSYGFTGNNNISAYESSVNANGLYFDPIAQNLVKPYSSSWDAAMGAAEKVSLEQCARISVYIDVRGDTDHIEAVFEWARSDDENGWTYPEVVAAAPTGPLAICRAIIDDYGGVIAIGSTAGKGTVAIVSIPLDSE